MGTESRRITGWPALGFWSLALSAVAFAAASALTVGVFVAPFALLLCAVAGLKVHAWPQALLGVLIGAGAVCLFIGFLHRGYVPCPAGPHTLAPGERFRCGGFDPAPWLTTGAGLVILGLVSYAFYSRYTDALIAARRRRGAV